MRRKTADALDRGALHHIETVPKVIADGGVDFVVRQVSNLARKAADAATPAGGGDPFMRPEPELFVADLSATHFALLNKYNVIDHHLLVVTRRYVDQEALLDFADFEALAQCMDEDIPVLGFYNGGAGSGASQPHKHLQIVPLPLSPQGPEIPIAALLDKGRDLPFHHALARLAPNDFHPRVLLERYRALFDAAGLQSTTRAGVEYQSGPYNLLVARSWMLLVPRLRESVEGIAVNALAYAGSLFVRDEARMQTVERMGPMAVLRSLAMT